MAEFKSLNGYACKDDVARGITEKLLNSMGITDFEGVANSTKKNINMIELPEFSESSYGITATNGELGEILINGTSTTTAGRYSFLTLPLIDVDEGVEYSIISHQDIAESGTANTWYRILKYLNDSYVGSDVYSYQRLQTVKTFTPDSTYNQIQVVIGCNYANNGVACSYDNTSIKPMLCKTSDYVAEFVPHYQDFVLPSVQIGKATYHLPENKTVEANSTLTLSTSYPANFDSNSFVTTHFYKNTSGINNYCGIPINNVICPVITLLNPNNIQFMVYNPSANIVTLPMHAEIGCILQKY